MDTSKTGFVKYWIQNIKSVKRLGWFSDSGFYKISFTPKDFNLIQDKVRIIPLGSIQNKYNRIYDYPFPFIRCIIYIKLKKDGIIHRIETSAEGTIGYPSELAILFTYLFNIDTFFKLEKTKEQHAFEITYPKLKEVN
jgi:hypothetical protein